MKDRVMFLGKMYIFRENEGGKCKICCQILKFWIDDSKRSSEILADEKTYFLRKVTWKSVTCEIFLDSLKNCWNRAEMLHCLRRDGRPWNMGGSPSTSWSYFCIQCTACDCAYFKNL